MIPFFSLPRVRQVRDEMAMELQMLKTELEVPWSSQRCHFSHELNTWVGYKLGTFFVANLLVGMMITSKTMR